MRNLYACAFALCLAPLASSAQSSNYQFFVDLTKVQDDRLLVSLHTPAFDKDTVTYYLPRIVPGTYSIYDFGRFASEFKALDAEGNALPIAQDGPNGWVIAQAKQLKRISYWIEDTWDTSKDNFVFEPAGTNIEAEKVFVMNTHGFFGYFKGLEKGNFEINIKKPANFYGSTSMVPVFSNDSLDRYAMPSYHELADAPIMYNEPDTAWLQVGGADILVSVYSPQKNVEAKFLAGHIQQVLEAQKSFLGGQIPVKKYAFIIYLFNGFGGSGYQGALEHSYSSLYYLPEVQKDPQVQEMLAKEINDVAAHEFFHTLTPLSIHSEEIHYFDFNNPQMSDHLWLYEGVTEYFANLVQVQYGLIEEQEFIDALRDKMFAMEEYKDDVPFTEMSAKCLSTYEDQYGNVYEKGALIGLCLDALLLYESDGKYRLITLLQDLSKKYGKQQPFKDEELFGEIERLSGSKRVREFLDKYVAGPSPLPLADVMGYVGYSYAATKKVTTFGLGNVSLGFNDQQELIVYDISELDEVGKKLGYQEQDIIVSINGEKIDGYTAAVGFFKKFQATAKEGDRIAIVVKRKNKEGVASEKKLKAKLKPTVFEDVHVLDPIQQPSEEQTKLRKIWLKQ